MCVRYPRVDQSRVDLYRKATAVPRMPRTIHEYQHRWQNALNSESAHAPWEEALTTTSCIIYESARFTPLRGGCVRFPDFGDAIGYYRYLRIPEELGATPALGSDVAELLPDLAAAGWGWSSSRPQQSATELRRRRYEGQRALDRLLARFTCEGYHAAMGETLIEIVGETLIDIQLHAVYALPSDLPALLKRFGSPFARDARRIGTFGGALAFDLDVSGHREALADHLAAVGQ